MAFANLSQPRNSTDTPATILLNPWAEDSDGQAQGRWRRLGEHPGRD